MTTRLLKAMGLDLGDVRAPAEARGGNRDLESRPIKQLNEEILQALGGSWSRPPVPPRGWERSELVASQRTRAGELIDELFSRERPWGWKDPVTSLTLPLWQQILPGMRYVICVRNPADTVASAAAGLRRLGQSATEAGLYALWLQYMASALVHTSGSPRILVRYDDYFEDSAGAELRLARFAGLAPSAGRRDGAPAIETQIDVGARHHRTPVDTVVADDGVPAEVASLHLIVRLLCEAQKSTAGSGDHDLARSVDRYARSLLEEALG